MRWIANPRLNLSLVLISLVTAFSPVHGQQNSQENALAAHMRPMLTGTGQWRTPNPEYSPETEGPASFGVRLQLSPDGSHVIGDLTGIYADGREVIYWTLMAFYNPVTDRIIFQQVGWNGALIRGESVPESGNQHTLDTVEYRPDGAMKLTRHLNTFVDDKTHTSDVFEREGEGWVLKRQWVWTLYTDAGPGPSARPQGDPGELLKHHAGYLNVGTGLWRAANPDHAPGNGEPSHYGLSYRWGPYRQFALGELESLFEDGRREKNHTLFLTVNPVTQAAYLEQAGKSGVYFRGELAISPAGRQIQEGLVFLPNGAVRSVRDEVEKRDEHTRVSHVFERSADGAWIKAREWIWRGDPGE